MSGRRRLVAVVDDDPRLLESLENLLESANYAVRTFSSASALIEAGLSDFDCLITDIGLPVMDGFALHDFVRKTRPELPVFLITGRHELDDERRANSKNASGFFRKPFDGLSLLTAVDDVLRT